MEWEPKQEMPHIGISEFAVMLAFTLGDSLAVEDLEACFILAYYSMYNSWDLQSLNMDNTSWANREMDSLVSTKALQSNYSRVV